VQSLVVRYRPGRLRVPRSYQSERLVSQPRNPPSDHPSALAPTNDQRNLRATKRAHERRGDEPLPTLARRRTIKPEFPSFPRLWSPFGAEVIHLVSAPAARRERRPCPPRGGVSRFHLHGKSCSFEMRTPSGRGTNLPETNRAAHLLSIPQRISPQCDLHVETVEKPVCDVLRGLTRAAARLRVKIAQSRSADRPQVTLL
jgi:hypothetical protein